jgi:hypothetical protein
MLPLSSKRDTALQTRTASSLTKQPARIAWHQPAIPLHTSHLAVYRFQKFEAGGFASSQQLRATDERGHPVEDRAVGTTCSALCASDATPTLPRTLFEGL